jgi:uncharacterized protein YbjT (DUF2867 family)
MSSSPKLIAVIGAGKQASGVIDHLLKAEDKFKVRAIVRNPSSDSVKTLKDKYSKEIDQGKLEIVEGDLSNPQSLPSALAGCYGVFASMPAMPPTEEGKESPEVIQGKALVNAAVAAEVEHFVYSSLPSIDKLSNGKYKDVFFFESKAQIEKYAREKLQHVTIVVPGAFYSNFDSDSWAKRSDDGVLTFCASLKTDTKVGFVDDREDIGKFVAAIFSKGIELTNKKTYAINAPPVTMGEIASTYKKVANEEAVVDPLSSQDLHDVMTKFAGPTFSHAYVEMMQALDSFPPSPFTYGPLSIEGEKDLSFEDLGVRPSTFEEYLVRTGWRAPRLH